MPLVVRLVAVIAVVFSLGSTVAFAAERSADLESIQPTKPEFEEFRPVVNWMQRLAPKRWSRLKFTYSFYDGLGVIHAYAMTSGSSAWKALSHSDFEMHDFFDAYRNRTHPSMVKPWAAVIVLVYGESSTFSAGFCFATPKPNDVEMEVDSMGCSGKN